jgi:plasmid stability protein
MPKVIQIRDVPDDVHQALSQAASAQGLSLTRYMLRELEQVTHRAQVVRANAAVARQTQAEVRGQVDRDAILEALREGRGE